VIRLGVTALSLTIVLGCSSAAAEPRFHTGNDLLALCATSDGRTDACFAYLEGIADVMAPGGAVSRMRACIPVGAVSQLHDIAVRYLEGHPATRQEAAAVLVATAYQEAFPALADSPNSTPPLLVGRLISGPGCGSAANGSTRAWWVV
jgi:hypothetical protein